MTIKLNNAIQAALEQGYWGISLHPDGYTLVFHSSEQNYHDCTEIAYYNLVWHKDQ